MKKMISTLVLLSILFQVSAQKKLAEGKVMFSIAYPELSGEMKQIEPMLPHSMTVYFKNEKARVEMPGMMMGQAVTVTDNKTNEFIIMMDIMGKKLALKQSGEERKKAEDEAKKDGTLPVIKITASTDTKVIAGYTCKKVIVEVTTNNETSKMDCYYTPELPKINDQNELYFKNINGFMMEYSLDQAGIKMVVNAQSVMGEKVADALFALPSDYKIVSQEELQKLMSAGEE